MSYQLGYPTSDDIGKTFRVRRSIRGRHTRRGVVTLVTCQLVILHMEGGTGDDRLAFDKVTGQTRDGQWALGSEVRDLDQDKIKQRGT